MSPQPGDSAKPTDEPIGCVEELVAYLRRGEKPPERWRVGTEHEKIGLFASDKRPIPYEGEHGIGAILEAVAAADDWTRIREGEHVVALQKDGASITLEPGGQLELSGAPLRTIHETCDEFHAHLALMKRVSDDFGVVWLGLGINPLYPVEDVPRMPKERYRIMREYLPTRGSQALVMMFATATVQANFDYESEADMVEKMRVSSGISPIVSSIFANSSLSEGKANGYVSRRLVSWEDTDPDRCGLPAFLWEPDFGFRRYVEWALDVPMFFVQRDGRYIPARGTTFRQFMERGLADARATLRDFDTHLTTLFPDVRLKHFIEVRGADAVPRELTCSLPALWKGVLYDAAAREAAGALVADATQEQRLAARAAVARRGLSATAYGRPALDLARELTGIAREGLRRIGHAGRVDPDETGYLDPIEAQLDLGASPGQVVLERWEGEWAKSVDRLIEYARY